MSDPHSRHGEPSHASSSRNGKTHYWQLLVMAAGSFLTMYILMYAMVDSYANVFGNLNQVYMAGLMTAPMVLIELAVMRTMYSDRRLNVIVAAAGVLLLVGCWTAIRQQAMISDRQFLRSMIPHHAGAILMCERAAVTDSEIQQLCQSIVRSQQAEIDLMKNKLSALSR